MTSSSSISPRKGQSCRPPSAVNWVSSTRRPAISTSRSAATSGRRSLARAASRRTTVTRSRARTQEVIEGDRRARPRVEVLQPSTLTIAGQTVDRCATAWRAPGLELFGPWEECEAVRDALVRPAGSSAGSRVGSRLLHQYVGVGCISSPLPAVYSGEKMRRIASGSANGYEATGSIGGSFVSDDIEDYYFTPYDLGYWRVREVRPRLHRTRCARGAIADRAPATKVTLAWNGDDV